MADLLARRVRDAKTHAGRVQPRGLQKDRLLAVAFLDPNKANPTAAVASTALRPSCLSLGRGACFVLLAHKLPRGSGCWYLRRCESMPTKIHALATAVVPKFSADTDREDGSSQLLRYRQGYINQTLF